MREGGVGVIVKDSDNGDDDGGRRWEDTEVKM